MITFKAIIEGTETSFQSTRKADIKTWAKEEIKKGAECVDVYASYKSPCADSLGEYTFSFIGSFDKDGNAPF